MDSITNINILSGDKSFPYIIKYIPGGKDDYKYHEYCYSNLDLTFKTELTRTNNTWSAQSAPKKWEKIRSKTSTLRIYFPEYSADAYSGRVQYALDVYTYLGNTKVILGSVILDRFNALATADVMYYGTSYYEYIDMNIIDPYDLIYSGDFYSVRKCVKGVDSNTDCSLLYCSLHVVECEDNNWVVDSEYCGGQNYINISNNYTDYLKYRIKWIEDEKGPRIGCDILFNNVYKQDVLSYIYETYMFNPVQVRIKYMISIDTSSSWREYISYERETSHEFNIAELKSFNSSYLESVNENNFSDWNQFEEGISFVSTAIISEKLNDEFVDKIILKSNKLPITYDIFSKLLIDDNSYININEIFKNDMNINVINTIHQSTVSYDIPDNSKSNIVIPVFYRVRDLGNIVIHPEVNENICINLDAYKSKVNSFILQIEGMKFNEIGTTTSGTIFKVIGASLPGLSTSGTYYILSQDGELITTGKYTYEK